ncbi:MAG: LLM class flavin-dependent oxidoreductase, partial [Rhodospirillaceae bacterium]|nr:LLM class flavin-dependent oxidoreductase [Rhodospirillaceae bacterium]
GAREAGRAPDRGVWRVAREIFVAESAAEARKEALEGVMARDFQDYFLRLLPKVGMLGLLKNDPDMADSDVTMEYLVDNVFIVGSVDEVAQKLNDLKGQIGDFGTLMAMGHEWEPYGAWHQSMSLLKNEVLAKVD